MTLTKSLTVFKPNALLARLNLLFRRVSSDGDCGVDEKFKNFFSFFFADFFGLVFMIKIIFGVLFFVFVSDS